MPSPESIEQARAVPIASIAPQGLRKSGKELIGPCPGCGGKDRFAINTTEGVFNCRGCGAKGDVIALQMFLDGCEFEEAVYRLANSPKPNGGGRGNGHAAPREPQFVAGDVLPLQKNEVRREPYFCIADGSLVKLKIKRKDDSWISWYRVEGGWQDKKPQGYIDTPFFKQGFNPFYAKAEGYLLWPEGEKDTRTVAELGFRAFTFGGVGDGLSESVKGVLPQYITGEHIVILADDDEPGEKHAQAKAAFAYGKAKSIRILRINGVKDVSDWVAACRKMGPDALCSFLENQADEAPLWAPSGGSPEPPPAEIIPFATFDAADWSGVEPDPRRWVTNSQIPLGEPGILSGDGGTGKTVISLQLALAVCLEWPDWLGKCVETHGPVIFYSVEEKLKELHRRVARILGSRRVSETPKDRLRFIIDPKGHVLAKPGKGNVIEPTLALHRLEKTVQLYKPSLIIIENAADVFGGNENDRNQVQPFMRTMLGALCGDEEATVMLLQHPSLTGLSTGSGTSGSTAWNNSARWRLNFKYYTNGGGEDDDAREMKLEKLNYGRRGEKMKLRWKDGVFVPDLGLSSGPSAAHAPIDETFLRCLAAKIAQGLEVGPNAQGSNYGPRLFMKMAEANGYGMKAFELAQERLLKSRRIVIRDGKGPPSKRKPVLTLPQ
jgi:hypothetical protein